MENDDLNILKNALGIQSPSTAFSEIGRKLSVDMSDINHHNDIMSPVEFEAQMLFFKERFENDEENVHIVMDELMCKVLKDLGYGGGVDVFERTKKWYA